MNTYIYQHPGPLMPARFVSRPHRFSTVCRLEEDGSVVESHLADPGRLAEVLVPGARVWLRGPFGPPRKLAWSTVMGEVEGVGVNLVASVANELFPVMLGAGLFPEIATGETLVGLDAEVSMGRSRVDFVAHTEEGSWVIEVKAMDLKVGGRAMWPDAPSRRGLKHVRLLQVRAARGEAAAMVFVAGRGDVEGFGPAAHVDPGFAEALADAVAAGVVVLAVRVSWDAVGAHSPVRLEVDVQG